MKKSRPRNSYHFDKMKRGDVFPVEITQTDPFAGRRALCAAYAYGRRNDQQYFGETRHTKTGKQFMDICRYR